MPIIFVRQRGHATEIRNNFNSVTVERYIDRGFKFGHDVVAWRWGTLVDIPARLVLNSREACALASNKPRVRQLCIEHGIRVPVTCFTAGEARSFFAETHNAFPLLWRPKSHRAGENMVVVSNADEVTQTAGYWSKILTKQAEFRVYVLGGKVIGVDEKIVEDKTQLAWNHALGGRFVVRHWDKWPSMVCWMSTKLCSLMGLYFGAVDLIRSEDRYYVLEVNTAPAMTSVYKIRLLQQAVNWLNQAITANPDHFLEIANPLPESIRGYRNYIHPLHNTGERG